jgi:hypothetical protein
VVSEVVQSIYQELQRTHNHILSIIVPHTQVLLRAQAGSTGVTFRATDIEDHGDGTYTVTFIPSAVGDYIVQVMRDGGMLDTARQVRGPTEPPYCISMRLWKPLLNSQDPDGNRY